MPHANNILYFDFRVGRLIFDTHPVFTAIQQAVMEGRIRITAETQKDLEGLSLHLGTRSSVLGLCLHHFNDALETTLKSAIQSGDEHLLPIEEAAIYSLLLSIDSFLFHS